MKKKFKITGVDCANCAAKMEAAVGKLEGVEEATLSFMTQKLILELDEEKTGEIIQDISKVCKKIDRHVCVVELK
ncbi:MAG TPA: cation transporter [Thermotogota bacterium]|nr:cation transporter [Thermotogota bacterium]